MFELPALPFAHDALAPHISAETIQYHYGKHHKGYVDKLNGLIPSTDDPDAELDELIHRSAGVIFNNAAQVWNHSFYWNCLSPKGGGEPTGHLHAVLTGEFHTIDGFKQKFNETAMNTFGSGWAWLVKVKHGVELRSTSNADTPLRAGEKPLLVCDVWEHAYYIDYRNARAEYLKHFWEIVNWEFVAKRLDEK